MELSEIIEAVSKTDAEEFKKALHEGAQKHYQMIFSDGHKSGKGQTMEKVDEMQKQIDDLNAQIESKAGELTAKDAEITKLSEKSPDLEKIKADYEEKLIAKDRQYAEKLKAAEDKHKELQQTIVEKQKGRVRQQIINELQGQHVDTWAANRAIDDAVMRRIEIGNDDSVKVYQPDGSTPYVPAEGQTAISLLVQEVVETIPKELIRPPKNNGSGYQGSGNGKSIPTTKKRSEMQRSEKIAFIGEHGQDAFLALPE